MPVSQTTWLDSQSRRSFMRATIGLLVSSVLVAGCTTIGPDDVTADPSAPIQTSTLQYRLSDNTIGNYELTIPWTFTNSASSAIYHDRCSSRLEKNVGGSWVLAYALTCPQSGPPLDSIAPGSPFAAEFLVYACYETNCLPRIEVNPIPGLYRLVVGLYANASLQAGQVYPANPLPLDARRSNAFWLDLP